MDFDSRIVQSKQYMSTALRENYNSNNISKPLTSSSQILDELRKKYDTPTRRQLKQIQTKPVYEKPQLSQQPEFKRTTTNMPTFGQGLARESIRRTGQQAGKYQLSPLYKKENLASQQETIFKKIKEMKDSLLNKNDKIKTTKSIYQPRYSEKPQSRPIVTDHRVENIDKINSKIQQILSCLKQTQKKSTLNDSEFKNSSKATIDNSQKTYNQNKSIGLQQRTVTPFYQQNKNILESKVQVKNTSSIYQEDKKFKISSPATKIVEGFDLGSNRQGSKVKSFINSIQKQTDTNFGHKYEMKSGKKLDDQIHKIQSKIQQFQEQKRKLNIQFKPYSYSNSKSTANLSKRSYTIDKNIRSVTRNQTLNSGVQVCKKFDDDSYSKRYGGYEKYGERQRNLSNKYPTRSSFQPSTRVSYDAVKPKNIQVSPLNVQIPTKPQKNQKLLTDSASSLFQIKLIPVQGDQKSNCSSRIQNRLLNQDLRRKADEGILDRKRKLTSDNSSKTSRIYIKKLVEKLSQQVTLDQHFRNNKLYFESNLDSNKWELLQSQLKKKGITLQKQKLHKIFKVTDQQNNPFFSVRESQSSLSILVNSFSSCEQHWKSQMLRKFSKQDLLNEQFNASALDLEKKGYIVLQDIVRFLNMQTGTFYRNRDLYLIIRRISQSQKITFDQLIQTFCK